MVGMRRHKNVTGKHFLPSAKRHAGDRGDQDYQEGGTMSGEDERNAARTHPSMDVVQYRCSNCIIGTENNPFICTQCGLANSDTDGQFVCRRYRKGPARGQGRANFQLSTAGAAPTLTQTIVRLPVFCSVITHSGFNFGSGPWRPIRFCNC